MGQKGNNCWDIFVGGGRREGRKNGKRWRNKDKQPNIRVGTKI